MYVRDGVTAKFKNPQFYIDIDFHIGDRVVSNYSILNLQSVSKARHFANVGGLPTGGIAKF